MSKDVDMDDCALRCRARAGDVIGFVPSKNIQLALKRNSSTDSRIVPIYSQAQFVPFFVADHLKVIKLVYTLDLVKLPL